MVVVGGLVVMVVVVLRYSGGDCVLSCQGVLVMEAKAYYNQILYCNTIFSLDYSKPVKTSKKNHIY